ncbi:substrate-binding domain-containing protein [Halomarina salina]|uniref:Substrate-binding domain-containing protein n=1 Tax=Halomarina salina TaxID=1872699 RepID=A0ABD5RNZ4_9EURY|nr:extracellular solute-binding protein [Halomarina salina]
MREQRTATRRRVLEAAGTVGLASVAGLAGCLGGAAPQGETESLASGAGTGSDSTSGRGGRDSLTVFHAGSLSPPFSAVEDAFEAERGVAVDREPKGSVGSTKKVTEQGRSADVLGVSDYRLLRDVLVPEFGDWYAIFATNALTIAYTDDSTGADEIGPDNWWEVLARDDVTFAHSDPAVDPNGYRSVMAMQLGAVEFRGERLFDESTSKALREKALVPTGTETELFGQLRSGKLDYAWQYQSAEASRDVNTVDLQPAVDLSEASAEYADHYANAAVEAGGTTYTGAPIAYGVAVPGTAEAPDLGREWVEFLVSEPGREILAENGFSPVAPAVVPSSVEGAVPENVLAHAEARETLGPLRL